MCSPYDAQPPLEPHPESAGEAGPLLLRSAEGTEFAAFAAAAAAPRGPAVVVLPDVRGLFPFYEELARRFAEHGYDAVTIDYFGRTAGTGERDADFGFWPHVMATTPAGVAGDVAAAVTYLRSMPDRSGRSVFTVGFCFGGSHSWAQAAMDHGLSGVVGFYGHPTREGRDGTPAVIDLVDEMECPVLGLMGGADESIPASEIARFDAALTAAGIAHDLHTYRGAPHSFFDRSYAEYAAEAADAWQRVLAFLDENG